MKRTFLLFTLFSFVAVSAFLIAENVNSRHRSNEKTERESGDKDDITNFVGFWNMLKANQVTHTIDLNDYYKARTDADYFKLHPLSRGGLNLQWQEMGPDNVGGRTRSLLFDKSRPGWVFAGSVSGGLWYSQNSGQSWNKVPGYNDFNSLTVSCMAQGSDSTIYIGTGESFGLAQVDAFVDGAPLFPGDGIWKSSDHGQTWSQIAVVNEANGLTTNSGYAYINRLTPGGGANSNKIYAAIYSDATHTGIQYWDGTKWNNASGIPSSGSTSPPRYQGTDVEVGSNGYVHAIVGNNAFGYKYYRSTDGITFTGSIIPGTSGANRIELAVSPTDPNYIYALSSYEPSGALEGEIQGVFKSTDAGLTWTQIAPTGTPKNADWEPVTQGPYALAIAVWPGDKNVVFIGGLDCYKGALDANQSLGYAWNKITLGDFPTNSNYVHVDIHKFAFNPSNPDEMFITGDGGLAYTTNAQVSYPTFGARNLQYNVTQFYACAAKPYTGEILGGAQDNENIYIDFKGNTTESGRVVKGSDGFDIALSYKNGMAMFAEFASGTVQRSSNNGGSFSSFFDCNIDYNPSKTNPSTGAPMCGGDGAPDDGGNFCTPFILWESKLGSTKSPDSSRFFLGTNQSIWMTLGALNFGNSSPTWYRLNTSSNGTFLSLAASADGSTVYGGTVSGAFGGPIGGALYRTSGLNSSISLPLTYTSFVPASYGIKTSVIYNNPGRAITGICVDPSDSNHVVITLGNYGNTDYVYETHNATDTAANAVVFNQIDLPGSGLPNMPVYSVIIDPQNSKNIIIGTELGVYSTTNGGVAWSEDNAGLDRTIITKLRSYPLGNQENEIYASTFGRGVFRTSTLTYTGINTPQPKGVNGVNLYPNPAANEIFVSVQLPLTGSDVELTIVDITGKKIKTISEGRMAPGYQLIKIPTTDLVNGTYLLNIRTDNQQTNKKFLILK